MCGSVVEYVRIVIRFLVGKFCELLNKNLAIWNMKEKKTLNIKHLCLPIVTSILEY